MGTPVTEVYSAFLSKVEQNEWVDVAEMQEAEADWHQLLQMAINHFTFPRKSLELIKEKEQYFFKEELGLGEIQVLSTYMKYEWLKRTLASWELMRQQYHTKDFEFFSPANLMGKIQESIQLAKKECIEVKNIYNRYGNGQPFNWGRLGND